MTTLYLVRHGKAAAGWDADHDPGLDPAGRAQAEEMAVLLASRGPLPLLVSPMARTRETAIPLAEQWQTEPHIEPRVSEIPSPVSDLAERARWLRGVAGNQWSQLEPTLQTWRSNLIEALREQTGDTVIVTHFIAINAAVGAAINEDRVVHFHPDYCSITTLRIDNNRLSLLKQGDEATTRVL